MKKNWPAFGLIGLLFAGLGIYAGGTRTSVPADPVAALFARQMPDATGTLHPVGQWKGKTVLLNFWATWCAPCVEEMPELNALQAEMAARNIQIIGIGIDSAANIAQFSSKYKISYPLYVAGMDGAGLSHEFGNTLGGLPFSVLIGPDGAVKKTYLGRLKPDQLRRDLGSAALP
jgi:thiol-disulfide isomerase/thioredoxin